MRRSMRLRSDSRFAIDTSGLKYTAASILLITLIKHTINNMSLLMLKARS